MSNSPFRHAALIEATLELAAARCPDPTPLVYARLFAAEPELEPYFWRDENGTIRGEMLSKVFDAILDFVGERRYAHFLITTEMVNHEGFDVPREIFVTFFEIVAATLREILDADWSPEMDEAWRALLREIQSYAGATPRSDVRSPAFPSYFERKAAAGV